MTEAGKPLELLEWLEERRQNCVAIAAANLSEQGKKDWSEDAEYFRQAIEALKGASQESGK